MSSGIEEKTPEPVKLEMAKQKVTRERGNLEYADTYFLAKLILFGSADEKLVAKEEWIHRTGKRFPYHPSFEGERYPYETLKSSATIKKWGEGAIEIEPLPDSLKHD